MRRIKKDWTAHAQLSPGVDFDYDRAQFSQNAYTARAPLKTRGGVAAHAQLTFSVEREN